VVPTMGMSRDILHRFTRDSIASGIHQKHMQRMHHTGELTELEVIMACKPELNTHSEELYCICSAAEVHRQHRRQLCIFCMKLSLNERDSLTCSSIAGGLRLPNVQLAPCLVIRLPLQQTVALESPNNPCRPSKRLHIEQGVA
jgi:hypothetical protein